MIDIEQTIIKLRPSPLIDITDKPLSEITPNSRHVREPVYFMDMVPIGGGPPIKRAFRLKRDTPACILNLWDAMVIVVETPWPGDREPLRKGKKNPMSRENNNRTA